MAHEIYVGSLVYGPAANTADYRPYENFILTVNPDRSRSMRVISRSPHGNIFRDVHQSVGGDWKAIDSYGRLFIRGEHQGTIWRRVQGDRLISHFWPANGELDTAEFPAPPNLVLGNHPLVIDSWKTNFYDMSQGGVQEVYIHTVSPTWNGATLGHGIAFRSTMEFLGRENVTVPAGTFETERFLWRNPHDDGVEFFRHLTHHISVVLLAPNDKAIYQLATLERIV